MKEDAMSILVVGATGVVGGQIVRGLREGKQPIRALVRGGAAHPKAEALRALAAEIVDGDITRPETLDGACQDVETVITTATSMPSGANDGLRRVDHDGSLALIAAAERANVSNFIYVSYSGNIREECPLSTAKRTCETQLLNGPMQAVILRPSYFMEMWLSPALGFDPLHGSARIYGSGEAKGSYISAFDVADFAVAAVTRDHSTKNTVLEMGGPDALSQLEAVAIFERALGSKIRLDFVPLEALQEQHRSSDPLQKTFAALMLGYAKGDVIDGARATAGQYGIKLRSVAQYASDVTRERQVVA
jgi:uncharacterized protein YbjT (DUF2867 family)